MTTIEAVLLDIDGVLTVSWQPLPGAVGPLVALRESGLPVRFLTNTLSRPRSSIADALAQSGFGIAPVEILTAPAATAAYLRKTYPGARCYLLSSGDVAGDFEGITLAGEGERADVVVLGGAGPEFSYERVNHAFHLLLGGPPWWRRTEICCGAPPAGWIWMLARTSPDWKKRRTSRLQSSASLRGFSTKQRLPIWGYQPRGH
jgi:ribonucleotide monophosphatase NagD (HAD superfamily)